MPTFDYLPTWKAARGYYELLPAFHWLSDEECDWWETLKAQHESSYRLPTTERSWQSLMGLRGENVKSSLDKETILERVEMLVLIERYGVEKIRVFGGRAKGLCPFHAERTASFSVDLGKKLWYCFGEATGGDAISFVMAMDKCTFREALKTLNEMF